MSRDNRFIGRRDVVKGAAAIGAVLLAGLALKNRRWADEGVSGPTDPSAPAT